MTLRWSDARTGPELAAAIRAALREAGSVTDAAKILGITRRHLTRVLGENPWLRETRETRETPGPGETDETPSLTEMRRGTGDGETPSRSGSLTYRRAAPSFRDVNTAPVATMDTDIQEERRVNIEPSIKQSNADRLELEAVREKQRTGASRPNKSVLVDRALELLWAQMDMERGR